jgi:hypothetical protein
MPEPLSPSPNEVLLALLSAHGYEAQLTDDCIAITGHEAQWSGEVHVPQPDEGPAVQLDINVHLPDGRTLTESFAGIGREPKFAMGDAFDTFSQSSFHVLLSAFFGGSGCETIEEWDMPTGRFKAFIGGATFRGTLPIEGQEMVRWFDTFADGILQAPFSHQQSHWVRLYYGQNERKMMTCEVLVDNTVWNGAQQAMAQYPWIKADAFYSMRVFLVLVPVSE